MEPDADAAANGSNGADGERIAVLGAGSWGTALAYSLAAHGSHRVSLWARRPDAAEEIARTRRNARYLPDAHLPARVAVTADLTAAVAGAWLWVFAVPSQNVRDVGRIVAEWAGPGRPACVVSVAKGIENETLATTTEVLREALPAVPPESIGVLYGPSHAEEVAAGLPTSVVVSIPDLACAERVQEAFMTNALRVYVNTDLIGVEIAGSVKNVMALAAGMGDGLGLGDNSKAALVTRGLAEVKRLGLAMGAQPETFAGLAGLGDLVVTCFSRHSRNRLLGEKIGAGKTLAEAEAEMTMVAEGVRTTVSTRALARRYGVEMPITEMVHAILFDGMRPEAAVAELMARDRKAEDAASYARA
ncbi:MAG TPA: NAD(P)H-dependent glycerol-3-phosphate dehydrogenase [Rubricoccaceae bacterium]|nr:NAD(P)H-dependent glycerol-3-phosphate dehydrogenase [Rubricoccaceae bacterium]